eukprot:CAMPEP_0171076628 /NCGR_PEP_ID=MMETSP0766_2-20121228/13537_1 /TAXON_ID=439317 /ORGANISM="Gambierdiscus australes, Strain CAWD 149" /LENGTH=100 /DNA_ID=CAMNT_0011533619 /DNA_START=251 /DNA_END=554 /DNA_ORIENTATION=-
MVSFYHGLICAPHRDRHSNPWMELVEGLCKSGSEDAWEAGKPSPAKVKSAARLNNRREAKEAARREKKRHQREKGRRRMRGEEVSSSSSSSSSDDEGIVC